MFVILFLAALGLLLFFHFAKNGEGEEVIVRVDGAVVARCGIDEEQTIPVYNEYGHNVIHVVAGEVYMEEADCPDHYCMRQGEIHRRGDTIVCLPHRLIVEITGRKSNQEEGEVDVIAQ